MEFIQANWDSILAVLAAFHLLALAIVNLTPTPFDDEWYGRVYKAVEWLAGIFVGAAKELPGERRAIEALDELDRQ